MKLITLFLTLIIISANSFAALSDGLPTTIKDALDAAYSTKNTYVIDAVIKTSKENYPNFANKIDSYISDIKTTKVKKQEPQKKESPFSGSIDTSLDVANGNTKRQATSLHANLKYKGAKFDNILKLKANSSKEDSVRTDEEYQISNQTNYNFTDRDYSFLELEYVNDRFNGYNYRTSELLGYGRKILKTDQYNLASEISAGDRQSSLTDNTKENSLLGKVALKGDWKITDKITFTQDISSSFGSEAVITISDSAIKTNIIDSLYLKLNYNIQHIDDVPANTQHTDMLTTLGVGYEF